MDRDEPGLDLCLEQAAFKNVEPPRGIGRRVINRAFAEVTALGGEYCDRHHFDRHVFSFSVHGCHTVMKR
jgi:hypothetical protein